MRRSTLLMLVAALAATLLGSCNFFPSIRGIDYLDEEVFVYEESAAAGSVMPPDARDVGSRGKGRRIDDFEYRISRVAQVLPVEVEGVTVQANDVVISGTDAYVVYNTAGEVFAGALQVIDFSRPLRPRIAAEIGLPHADVNAVAVTDTHVYIAGAWDPDHIAGYDPAEPDRAFVARIALDELDGRRGVDADDIDARKVILDSYAATGIAIKDDTVFVSTGARDGTIQILDRSLSRTGSAAFGDLRDIERFQGGVVALQGTDESGLEDGRILILRDDGTERTSVVVADFDSPENKATIEVYENRYAFLGLSEAGFQVVYLREEGEPGDPVESVYTIPNLTDLGWTTKTNTNSASYSDDLIFTANGEGGFRVFRVTEELDKENPVTDFAELVGFVPFDETDSDGNGVYWSANHVEYRSGRDLESGSVGFLAVASGEGGVNLYYLRVAD